MNTIYDEIKELTLLCPELPYFARMAHLDPEILSLIERAEREIAEEGAS